MILVDFSHLSARNLYTAISQAKPKKKDGKYITEEFINFYYHLMLKSLVYIHKNFQKTYGDIILALDDRNYWRKEVYPEYKSHRKKNREKSEVDFESFYKYVEEFVQVLDECFPYKVLRYPKAEADDIIGVLTKAYSSTEDIVVITSDKDMKQVLEYGAKLYDPIKQTFIKMSPNELKEWKIQHILCGDSGDNIPHIKRGTQFTDNFISYLKNNGIYLEDPYEFERLSISKKLYEEYDVKKRNKKGEELDELDIFKATPFGPATAKKFAKDLKENLKENPIYIKNFERNKKLILFEYIPEEIQQGILGTFKEITLKYNPDCIMKFLMKHSLKELLMNISEFHIAGIKAKEKTDERNNQENDWFL